MDHNSIIDRNTYEVYTHAEDAPIGFVCDMNIAPAIAILNKKGYETFASCSGHYKLEFYEYFDEDIKKLNEYKESNHIIIKKIKDKTFDYWEEVDKTLIYILFKKDYEFKTCPQGFTISQTEDGRTMIESIVDFYDNGDEKKPRSQVENEIDEKCQILNSWVEELPYKERND